ncbi:rare lipoprotein A [Neolewinella xylanilytica]|uniref:Probable endolytic peptidoglycan transglycosylase RlpA n=1 Tax=Neolewinella xylanilytica TaxID=1514080 RepID=A0A2S6I5R3_9BACT|nr:SPOR domain-containing protein [Neolewinella xylanilytica]PPK86495.1 rare lipoprotein A [Neolewinella xylanilytica]
MTYPTYPPPRRLLLGWLLLLLSCALNGQLVGDRQNGLASYYSPEYDGAETAYGVIYDRTELVAAHKTYPLNSTVRVTNENNGKSVVVRIVDKGPFIRGRIVELSERAADELGMLGERTVPVELQLLATPDQRPLDQATPPPVPPASEVVSAPAPRRPEPLQEEAVVPEPTPSPDVATPGFPAATPPSTSAAKGSGLGNRRDFGPGLYRVRLEGSDTGRFGVQVGSFKNLESAMDMIVNLQGRYFDEILLHKESASAAFNYRVILGTFADKDSAKHYAASLKQRYGINGFTIDLPR